MPVQNLKMIPMALVIPVYHVMVPENVLMPHVAKIQVVLEDFLRSVVQAVKLLSLVVLLFDVV